MLLPPPDLDDLDFAILSQLQKDGRKPFTDIASSLNVTSSTIKNRYSRLTGLGIVDVVGSINPYLVGFRTHLIMLVKVKAGFLEAVAEAIADFAEVDFVAITSGDYDLDLTVSCRDHEHLLEFVNKKMHAVEGVLETRTKMILRVVKNKQANVSLLRSLATKPDSVSG